MPGNPSEASAAESEDLGHEGVQMLARTLEEPVFEATIVEPVGTRRTCVYEGDAAEQLPYGLPVVPAGSELKLEVTYEDRLRSDLSWYVPEYVGLLPEGPLLLCEVVGHQSGTPVWGGTFRYEYASRTPTAMADLANGDEIRPAPACIGDATLRIPEIDSSGERTWVEHEPSALTDEAVEFEFTGEDLEQVYQLLARVEFDPEDRAGPTLAFDVHIDAWNEVGGQRDGDAAWSQPVVTTRLPKVSREPVAINFDAPSGSESFFSTPPVVLAGVQTVEGSDPVQPRLPPADTVGVEVRLERSRSVRRRSRDRDDDRDRRRFKTRRRRTDGDHDRDRPRVRDHRKRDNRRRKRRNTGRRGNVRVRDHRRKRRGNVRVRDHRRKRRNTGRRSNVRVRDHRQGGGRNRKQSDDGRDRVRVPARRGRSATSSIEPETVGVLALPNGPLLDVEGIPVGEAMLEARPSVDEEWHVESTTRAFDDPVVLPQVTTAEDAIPVHIGVRNVDRDGFEYVLKPRAGDDDPDDPETVGFVVLEQGRHELVDGTRLEVGTLETDHDWASVVLRDDFEDDPVVISQPQTRKNEPGVLTRQRAVGADEVRIKLQPETGESSLRTETVGYCVASVGEPRYDLGTFTVEQPVPVSYPCSDHRHAYAAVNDLDETVTFGCTPPWEESLPEPTRYELVRDDSIPAPVRVLRSLTEEDTFLVVPERYVIGRDPETGSPSVYVAGKVSPSDANLTLVQLDVALVPALTPYDRAAVEQHLYAHTREVNGTPARPTIQWPTDVFGALNDYEWSAGLDVEGRPTPVGRGLQLTANFRDTAEATLAFDRMRQAGSNLTGTIEWAFGETATASSAVVLDLEWTTGDVLEAITDPDTGAVTLESSCDRPVRVDRLLLYDPDHTEPAEHNFDKPIELEPGESQRIENVLEEGQRRAAADFTVDEDPASAFVERRIDVDRLEVPLTVTARLGEVAETIETIELHVRFPAVETTRHLELIPEDGSFAGVTDVASFRLPVTYYLSPDDRVLEYDATVRFGDDRDDLQTGWQTHGLGDAATLVLRPEGLGIG